MENQTIREQIFDALFDYTEKWGSICTESDCATVCDEICLRIDQSKFTADEAEEHINQEVEMRIAEMMPSPSDKLKGLREYQFNVRGRHEKDYITEDFLEGVEWLRSRLTCSEKPNNLKTEGGGE